MAGAISICDVSRVILRGFASIVRRVVADERSLSMVSILHSNLNPQGITLSYLLYWKTFAVPVTALLGNGR